MPTTTEMRDAYIGAEYDILQHGQSTRLDGRILTMADLPQVRQGRREWESRANAEAAVALGRRAGYAVARMDDA